MAQRHWYLVAYDIREPKRLQKVARIVGNYGDRVQYSLFRCRLNPTEIERMRWELSRVAEDTDDLMFIRLCPSCVKGIESRRDTMEWPDHLPSFRVL